MVLLLLTGCTSPRLERELKDIPLGRSYEPQNVFAQQYLLPTVGKVAVLPIYTGSVALSVSETTEAAFFQSLRQFNRFELVMVPRQVIYEQTGRDAVSVFEPLPADLLDFLVREYAVDAVLQSDLTVFRPYKPMQMGVRAQLFVIVDQEIIWSCDELFDAGEKSVVTAARRYAEHYLEQPYPLQSSFSVFMTPQRFAGYVGHALFATLPPRP